MSLDAPKNNKMIGEPPAKKAFHFSGDGIYRNLTILASNRDEATKEWLAKREPIEQSTPEQKGEAAAEVQ